MGQMVFPSGKNHPPMIVHDAVTTAVQETTHPADRVTQKDIRRHQVEGVAQRPFLRPDPPETRGQTAKKPPIKNQPAFPYFEGVPKPQRAPELLPILKDVKKTGSQDGADDHPNAQI